MIFPFLLLALGLGAFAAYELVPKAHTWVDDHVKSIQDAVNAHQVAEGHLGIASNVMLGEPSVEQHQVAQSHAVAAQTATTVTAHNTARAAQTAQTPAQRAVATWMAVLTLAMQDQIKAFAAFQVAASPQEQKSAHEAFDVTVEKIRLAKAQLSRLGVAA